ncbi:LysE family translocator [Brevundimonas sp. 2R-24]|uniref:LysE family translocator n=1 Tax=Peiella sedimenti TaxID=3061083 RepID=A0ABT8SPN9_9CAUL|nr:LysE family translocator [Caulobacteraceae bacterium XZ-24]
MESAPLAILAFTAAAALLTVTPGMDTALILRTALVEGPRPAWRAALGILTGCMVWAGAVGLGLGALLLASETAYRVVQVCGAVYLAWLGLKLILKPRRDFAVEGLRPATGFRQGLLTNLLNPKVGVFYISFLPQFIPHGAPVAAWAIGLALIHAVLGALWSGALIAATQPLAKALRRPGLIGWLDRVTGGVFIAFGLKLGLSAR